MTPMKKISLLLLTILSISFCNAPGKNTEVRTTEQKEVTSDGTSLTIQPDSQAEQISCSNLDCSTIDYSGYEELDEKINELMDKNAGKIFIQMRTYNLLLSDEPLAGVVPYLRELSEKGGRVSVEPYYMGERSVARLGFSFVKDAGMVGWNIYSRLRDTFYYRHTKNYNAKVLYHPKYHTIMMIYFVHKNYGDVCQTIYSRCTELEYLDDDTFDLSLSTALKEASANNTSVKINFRQEKAKLFEAKLDTENFKKLSKSARLYKWLILAKETEKKPKKRERFMGISLAISVLDYSMTLYDLYKQYKIYNPVLDLKAELTYTGEEKGGTVESVVFYKPEPKE